HSFGDRLGAFTAVGRRTCYPLTLRIAGDIASGRVVRIGNAAQTLHPVAGQGLNLGLRDAWELARALTSDPAIDPGDARRLSAYARGRRLDRNGTVWFTHGLVRLFAPDAAPLRFARACGLAALGAFPPARAFLARRMTFGARG